VPRLTRALIINRDDRRFIRSCDDEMRRLRRAERVPESSRELRVLLAVSPPLLGDLLARRIALEGVEVVLLEERGEERGEQHLEPGTTDRCFDIVITTGRPPARIEADAVLRLPSPLHAGVTGSLLTAGELERVRVDRPSDVVDLVRELGERPLPGNE
jgi:hypothetical protein